MSRNQYFFLFERVLRLVLFTSPLPTQSHSFRVIELEVTSHVPQNYDFCSPSNLVFIQAVLEAVPMDWKLQIICEHHDFRDKEKLNKEARSFSDIGVNLFKSISRTEGLLRFPSYYTTFSTV